MFYLTGGRDCLRTIMMVSAGPLGVPANIDDLKSRYHDFCRTVGGPLAAPSAAEGLECYSAERISYIISHYLSPSPISDLPSVVEDTPQSSQKAGLAALMKAKEALNAQAPDLGSIFDVAIHTLIYQRSPHNGGGTISSLPGVIWSAARKHWAQSDLIEFLLHEFSHTLVFLDERAWQHYVSVDALAEPAHFALSSILRISRPLDKAFHSLIVGYELLSYRRIHGEPDDPLIHPHSDELLSSCQLTTDSIYQTINKYPLVTPRI
jgi:hypothetical protein